MSQTTPLRRIELRSVNDGVTRFYYDDGYKDGDSESPCTRRKRLEYLAKEKAEDGEPCFYLVKAQDPWVHNDDRTGRQMFTPVDFPVWSKREDKRLADIKERRAARSRAAASRLASRAPRTAELGKDLARAGVGSGLPDGSGKEATA